MVTSLISPEWEEPGLQGQDETFGEGRSIPRMAQAPESRTGRHGQLQDLSVFPPTYTNKKSWLVTTEQFAEKKQCGYALLQN